MTYPFRQARFDYGPRKGPALAFLVHMAEGGGTVGYLAGDPARGVSVHFVVEYSGRVVQMLLEGHASGSIDPTKIRTTNDGMYGIAIATAVLGPTWVKDPNSAVISCEIEGFAVTGPNDDQVTALVGLVNDVRSRYPAIGLLGHRDFADYKACPGRFIPWARLGGHGPAASESPMKAFAIAYDPKLAAVKVGAQLYRLDLTAPFAASNVSGARTDYIYTTGGVHYRLVEVIRLGVAQLVLVKASDCTLTAVPPPVVSCDDVVTQELALAADRAAQAVRSRPA